jgi:hypothetical protein
MTKIRGAACAVLAFMASANTSAEPLFEDASAGLPEKTGRGFSMNAKAADLDGDGDLDIVSAMEYQENRLLLNDGKGGFADASLKLPRNARDSEEIALVDVDGDTDLDIVVANEDDLKPELYLNDGKGAFKDASDRLRVHVKANAVLALDVDADRDIDLIFGGDKVSALLINRGRGRFVDESYDRLPARHGANQDIAAGDLDGDKDVDLVLANEDGNQIYLNDGKGVFTLAPRAALAPPERPEETRDVELLDVDSDGDLDIVFANVRLWNPEGFLQNRLLLNDGKGVFVDATKTWLPLREEQSFSALPIDLDADGKLDLVFTTLIIEGKLDPGPVRALRNTGSQFVDATDDWLPRVVASGFDTIEGDFDGDGRTDLFVSSRGGQDVLLRRAR